MTDPNTDTPPLLIRRVDAIPVALPLTTPMRMAGITITSADNLLVRIEAANGTIGWGEAASAPTMTGDTQGGLVAAVRDHLAPLLVGQNVWTWPALRPALHRALMGNTGAHSAIEMAVLDLQGRASGTRLVDLIGGAARPAVTPMWLLGNKTAYDDITEARQRRAQGFGLFKLKIGAKTVDADIATTHAVRAAFPDWDLCADANCGLSRDEAARYIDATRDARLSFVEQPIAHDDFDGVRALAARGVPIGIDEGIHAVSDIGRSADSGARGVSLKLIKLGGLTAAMAAANECRARGLSINVAAKIAESGIASAAAVHLACAVPNVDWGVSITHFYLAADILRRPLAFTDGAMPLPEGAGLGVEVDEDAVARVTVR